MQNNSTIFNREISSQSEGFLPRSFLMLKGKARSNGCNSSIRASSRNMSINATNQKVKVGAVQVIKATATATTAAPKQANPTQTQTTTANSKLIKKAHVRFDDYLDLNEENMRRSCKRLMNHLYSDSTTNNENISSRNKETQNVAPAKSHCRSQSQQQKLTNKCPNNIQTGASIESVQNSNLNRTLLQQQAAKTLTSRGKSYLRSQYERRQLRQFELMQQATTTTNKQIDAKVKSGGQATDGAIISDSEEENRRRQQQDLMAKSHELSKRRFFEKLERRESLKNLNPNLNINSITPIIKQESENTAEGLRKRSEITKEGEEEEEDEVREGKEVEEDDQRAGVEQKKPIIESKSGCISNNIAENADDELMLKAYRSILKGSTELRTGNNDTLGELDGTRNAKELTGELLEFYPQLLESANACELEHKQEQLIEASESAKEFSSLVAETSATTQVASDADESAFEIRVTGTECDFSVDSLDQIDRFINSKSNLLVVKPVESVDVEGYRNGQQEETDSCPDSSQWLSFSNGRIEATETSIRMVSNKMKTPLLVVDATENNNNNNRLGLERDSTGGEQISNGSGNEKRTCESSELIALAQKSMPIKSPIMKSELSTPPASSQALTDGDNQHPAAGISSTISSKRNFNETKTISSLDATAREEREEEETEVREEEEVKEETTGIVERVSEFPRKSDNNEYFTSNNSKGNEQQSSVIKVSESNCAKKHELPETMMLVGQSGGAAEKKVGIEEPSSQVYTCARQIESAAQAQQVVNLQREITKLAICDVLPGADGIGRKEIVSENEEKVKDVSGCYSTQVLNEEQYKEQRAPTVEQNSGTEEQEDGCRVEKQEEVLETDGYANPRVKQNATREKNSTIDVNEVKMNLFECRNNGELMSKNNQLIKSYNKNVHTKLEQKQNSSVQSTTAEEDNGSSCSSSGFGASASSSDGSASIKGTDSVVAVGIKRDVSDFRRPNSLAIKSLDSTCNFLYDSLRFPRNSVRIQQSSDEFEFPDYKLLVGPDQGYPTKSSNRTLVIENHNYASVENRCELGQSKLILDKKISSERDDFVGYANLPRKKIPPVEYATVRPISNNSSKNNLKTSPSEISLSAKSNSTTSGNSGGFSALPPAKVEHNCSPANNFESLVSLNADSSHRKSSIFKRFGSLVSKAFTGTGASVNAGTGTTNTSTRAVVQSVNPEIINNDQQATQKFDYKREKSANQSTDFNGKSKLALVIEQDHHKVTSGEEKVEEADLVILPAKHVNHRKQHQHQQQQEQNLTIRRHDDDSLSRGKKHSRKMKQTDLSTSIDSASTTSSYSSSSSISNHFRRHRDNEHLRKADSLSEDLESLMSRSERSNGYEKQKNLKSASNKIETLVNVKNRAVKSSLERIEIDCIQPNKADDGVREFKNKRLESRHNQRSISRLLNKTPTAKSTIESNPNLMKSQSRGFRDSTHNSAHQVYRDESEGEEADGVQQPISGFWGISSLMSRSHAKTSDNNAQSKSQWRSQSRIKDLENLINQNVETSVYSSLQPLAAGYKLHLSAVSSEEHQIDKCQSLNLYQNLLRNYSKRRHRHRSHHNHHGHHHHHGRVHHSTSRHAHLSTRCGKNCPTSTNSGYSNCNDKPVVWGQLIKINKSDGSQVIELQRSPGRPWGFFVARGAINNTKGKLDSKELRQIERLINSIASLR